MSMESHITTLADRHHKLEVQLQAQQHQPGADALDLKSVKKQKLALKDAIARLRAPH